MFSHSVPQPAVLANVLACAAPLRVAVDTWDSAVNAQLMSMLSAFDDVLVCDADSADVTIAIGDAIRGSGAVVALVRDEAEAARALSAGANGTVLRSASPSRIHAALHAVAEGLYVSEVQIAIARESAAGASLTARENDVVRLLAAGLTNKEIAQRLGITENTVKFHVNGILGKLGVETRTEAVVHAARLGIVTL